VVYLHQIILTLEQRKLSATEEHCYVMLNGAIFQEDTVTLNVYAPNHKATKYLKQN
jgi:hypothetical protein